MTCGKEIHEKAVICPGCGCTTNRVVGLADNPYDAAYPPGSFRLLAQKIALYFSLVLIPLLFTGTVYLASCYLGYYNRYFCPLPSFCLIANGIIGGFLLLAIFVMTLILLYRSWAVIQGGKPRTTPGKAVGYCFIPFFSCIWIFHAIVGLVTDMNGYRRRFGLKSVQPLGTGLAIVISIVALLWPILGLLWFILWMPFGFSLARFAEAVQRHRMETKAVVIPQEDIKPKRLWNTWTILLAAGVNAIPVLVCLIAFLSFPTHFLHDALTNDNYTGANIVLIFGADADAVFFDGVSGGRFDANFSIKSLQFLINKGADVNTKKYDGETPLHRATRNHDVEKAKFLIKNGADVNAKDDNGETPLYKAAKDYSYYNRRYGKEVEILKCLIENGADVNAKNRWGETPLDKAGSYSSSARILREASE